MLTVTIKDLKPQDLEARFRITVYSGEYGGLIFYSPLSYIREKMLSDSSSTALKNLLKAIYDYNRFAKYYITGNYQYLR